MKLEIVTNVYSTFPSVPFLRVQQGDLLIVISEMGHGSRTLAIS